MTKYCTIGNVKETLSDITYENLGFDEESEFDRFISRLIDRASRMIDRWCRRPSDYFNGGASITECHNGKACPSEGVYPHTDRSDKAEITRRTYRLGQFPVLSVTSVHNNASGIGETPSWGSAITAYTLDNETGEIVFGWNVNISVSVKNLRFIYEAGYDNVPDEIEWACEEMVVNAIKKMMQDGVNMRIKFGRPMPIGLKTADVFTDSVKELLDPYRKVRL